jgi:hypothetical protein
MSAGNLFLLDPLAAIRKARDFYLNRNSLNTIGRLLSSSSAWYVFGRNLDIFWMCKFMF